MPIPSSILRAFLVLLLLATQQLGTAHLIAHAGTPLQSGSRDQQLPSEPVCDQCLAYAAMGSALTTPALVFLPARAEHRPLLATGGPEFVAAADLPFDSRAPPSIA